MPDMLPVELAEALRGHLPARRNQSSRRSAKAQRKQWNFLLCAFAPLREILLPNFVIFI
jgi:hypothetical protein